jgi:hypothetical protein
LTKTIIIFLVLTIITAIFIFVWFYLFNIYEVKISVIPESKILKSNDRIEINIIPLNSFGTKALWRSVNADYEIIEGEDLVNMKRISESAIEISSKGPKGNVVVLVTPSIGLFSSKISIKVE